MIPIQNISNRLSCSTAASNVVRLTSDCPVNNGLKTVLSGELHTA